MTIQLGDFNFSYPAPLGTAIPGSIGGVYCLSTVDAAWGPQPYRPVYFGELHSFAERCIDWTHDAIKRWHFVLGKADELHLSLLPIADEHLRSLIEASLIERYSPLLNIQRPLGLRALGSTVLDGDWRLATGVGLS